MPPEVSVNGLLGLGLSAELQDNLPTGIILLIIVLFIGWLFFKRKRPRKLADTVTRNGLQLNRESFNPGEVSNRQSKTRKGEIPRGREQRQPTDLKYRSNSLRASSKPVRTQLKGRQTIQRSQGAGEVQIRADAANPSSVEARAVEPPSRPTAQWRGKDGWGRSSENDRRLTSDTEILELARVLSSKLARLDALPSSVPPVIREMPSSQAIAESIGEEAGRIREMLTTIEAKLRSQYGENTEKLKNELNNISREINDLEEERDAVFNHPEVFDSIVREADSEAVSKTDVAEMRRYLIGLSGRLGYTLLMPDAGDVVDHDTQAVERVEGPVRGTPLTVLRRLATGYTDGKGTLVRARVVAHHPEDR